MFVLGGQSPPTHTINFVPLRFWHALAAARLSGDSPPRDLYRKGTRTWGLFFWCFWFSIENKQKTRRNQFFCLQTVHHVNGPERAFNKLERFTTRIGAITGNEFRGAQPHRTPHLLPRPCPTFASRASVPRQLRFRWRSVLSHGVPWCPMVSSGVWWRPVMTLFAVFEPPPARGLAYCVSLVRSRNLLAIR